ncbi:unnamed protein product, partial [Litomosoides sigmodontis]
MIKTLFNVHDS